ncbi:MAG: LysR family transcriptional regulator, partial [Burkholderiales bacterium]
MFSDLNDIRLFAEVVRQRSVTKGAIALGMPAATVSRRLAALEKEFGVRLVERSARRFDLTEAGAACHRVAQRAMEGLEQAKHELEGVISRPLGHLRLTAPPDFATAFLAEPLVAFAAQYPDISISLDVSSRRVSLVDENFDIVIRMGRLDDSLHVSQRLMALSRGLYASREWSTRVTLPDDPAALSNAQCVTLEAYSTHGELALQRIDRPSVKRVVPVHERMSVNSM